MKLRKQSAPGSAPGGLTWATPDDVVEVPDDLAVELLAIRDAGFEHVPHLPLTADTGEDPGADPEVPEEPADDNPEAVVEEPEEVTEAPKRKYTRRATGQQAVSE
ncbi:hypothetical protein ACFYUY_01330 [Kitasatospora sp. NPDC004745]|uniref:hypothetical protein n=1 Tax=Kitasatospora sp. NPDC004745 TaxID=3364019 RepID=UPI0036790EFB